ncbi:hypothetical protein L596_000849 [Steinernema carpocapsae]|uniref:BZIP domain-containing protein n=1 Tax=Steinernema carpocapsae TaxID=34508 RepID=A0A4U8UJF4_STECR|nr:hypothetical protein L596_000849 [Steinernema carpocapsae]
MQSPNRFSESSDDDLAMSQHQRKPEVKRQRGRPMFPAYDPTKQLTKKEQELQSKRDYARQYREKGKSKVEGLKMENEHLKAELARMTLLLAEKDKQIEQLTTEVNGFLPSDLASVIPYNPAIPFYNTGCSPPPPYESNPSTPQINQWQSPYYGNDNVYHTATQSPMDWNPQSQ